MCVCVCVVRLPCFLFRATVFISLKSAARFKLFKLSLVQSEWSCVRVQLGGGGGGKRVVMRAYMRLENNTGSILRLIL